jgi:outer membrane protein assembly factor BamB
MLRRFWWLWTILACGLAVFIVLVISGTQYDKESKQPKDNEMSADQNESRYNERIVKTYLPESGAAFKYTAPLLHDGYLYLGTSERTGYDNAPLDQMSDNFFYKLDLDLNVVWQYPLEKRMVGGGATMDTQGNLYFVVELVMENPDISDEIKAKEKEKEYYAVLSLVSLDGAGNFRWEQPISQAGDYWNRSMHAPAISADDVIYVGHERFYAFDTAGNQLGQYPAADMKILSYSGAPVIDSSGSVYFAAPEPVAVGHEFNTEIIKAYKFSPGLASLVWSAPMGNEIMSEADPSYTARRAMGVESTPSLGNGGKNLYAITGCTISKIDTATGRLVWATKPEGIIGYISASPAIDALDNLYVGTKANEYSKFYAITSDGTVLWRRDTGADMYTSPILGDDDAVYAGSETLTGGKFFAFDRLTGEIRWTIGKSGEKTIPDFSLGSMLLYQGYVYIGVHTAKDETDQSIRNQSLFKIRVDADGYLPQAAWPRIHGSNANTGRLN